VGALRHDTHESLREKRLVASIHGAQRGRIARTTYNARLP
jgi:hypothetical protein